MKIIIIKQLQNSWLLLSQKTAIRRNKKMEKGDMIDLQHEQNR